MAVERTDEEIRQAVVKNLIRLQNEGKDILGGYFTASGGNVQLRVLNHSETEYSVNYCFYSRMWDFRILKTELAGGVVR